ncbi:Predicted membrane protein [Listeria grayi]|nr:Predicted membrane protein [Listeria grayi]
MEISLYTLLAVIGCGIVTWLPRVAPFMLVRKWDLPEVVMQYLSYVPLCILTALFIQGLLVDHPGHFPGIKLDNLLAALPSI